MNIDRVEVGHMPTLLVMTQGLGYIVHGEEAVEDIVKELSGKDWWLAHRHQRTKTNADKKNSINRLTFFNQFQYFSNIFYI